MKCVSTKIYSFNSFPKGGTNQRPLVLVLDRDTFQLELDYRSIMHINVKVPSNQDFDTRMALKPVRV